MGTLREVFDVKQHPLKYGEPTDLEKVVQAMESRFKGIYEQDFIDTFGSHFCGFKTPNGTHFFVNGVYEWNAVFLEYDDGEDGDRFFLDECDDEDAIFRILCLEIENGEA